MFSKYIFIFKKRIRKYIDDQEVSKVKEKNPEEVNIFFMVNHGDTI